MHQCGAEICARLGAGHLFLFGSAARDELRDESDIDVLVECERAITYDGYYGPQEHLEELLGRPTDLVTDKGLKPRVRRHVEKDLIRVA